MKYKLVNDNLKGGAIPIILGITTNKTDKIDYINNSAPLYFNLGKNPIVNSNNNLYKYDYTYKPDSQVLRIDTDLNLRYAGRYDALPPPVPNRTYVPSKDDIFRVIQVNGIDIPYYYGKIHTNKELFGKIKLLFQYIDWKTEQDGTKTKIAVIKKEDDIIDLIDSMFIISDELNVLVSLSKSLNNIIDKYIFINKFYELLEIITWTPPPDYTIEQVSRPEFNFRNIPTVPIEKKRRNYKSLQTIINKGDFAQLATDDNLLFDKFVLQSSSIHLSDEKKQDYIRFITCMDFIFGKLKDIFDTSIVRTDSTKINLINLIDLYLGYTTVFKDSINPKFNDNIQVCKFVNTIDKINIKQLTKIIFDEALALYRLRGILDKIKNWPINYFVNDLNIHLILVLSYFDMRINQYQISQGKYINAIPINKTEALSNLFGNGRSYIQPIATDRNKIRNTAMYFSDKTNGPEIERETPWVNYEEPNLYLNFPVCVENTILQFVKCLFWDYTNGIFSPNPLGLFPDNFLVKYMEEYNKIGFQSDEIVNTFVKPIINIKGINYMKNDGINKYEYNATTTNFVKTLLLMLKTSWTDIKTNPVISTNSVTNDIREINSILSPHNFEVEITDESTQSNPNTKKVELRKDGNTILIIKLYRDQHGDSYKPNDIDIDDCNPSILYFTNYVDSDNNIFNTCDFCTYLFKVVDINRKNTIINPYFNSSNIYWLNFMNGIRYINTIADYINDSPFINKKKFLGEYFEILNTILKIKADNNKEFYKNNYDFLYYYFLYLLKYIDVDDNPKIYEESKEFIINNIQFLDSYYDSDKNILKLLLTKIQNIKYSSLIYLIKLIISHNAFILWDYEYSDEVPLNIFIYYYQHIYTTIKSNQVIEIISLLSSEKTVLYRDLPSLSGRDDITAIKQLPLYKFLSPSYYSVREYLIQNKPKLYISIIKNLIDPEKFILNRYHSIISPLSFYFESVKHKIIPYLSKQKELSFCIGHPIKILQTPINIIDTDGISLFYKITEFILTTDRTYLPYFVNTFILNKLLIDPDIEGNQPALNTISNGYSILYYYLNNLQPRSYILDTFNYLYNKKLLVGTVEPLWGYLSNPNLTCNTYLPEIICKLSESFVYNGRYYTPTINKLPNGLLPAVFVAKKMTELNDTDLSTFIKNPNSIAIFTCLCNNVDKELLIDCTRTLYKFTKEKIESLSYGTDLDFTSNLIKIYNLFRE
jgi:hypothetical protein